MSDESGPYDHSKKGDAKCFLKFLAPKLPVMIGGVIGAHYGGSLGALIGGLTGAGIVYALNFLTAPRRGKTDSHDL